MNHHLPTSKSPFFCSSSNPCPSGMFCFNGLCAIGCTSNENCADDQYCDGLYCVNTEVPTCTSDSNCYEGQICVQGVCSTPPPSTTCDPDQVVSGNDGCDNYSLCIDGDDDGPEDPACYTMPPCAEDGTCPVGAYGAVCNNDYINKARICLIGACEAEANCHFRTSVVKSVTLQSEAAYPKVRRIYSVAAVAASRVVAVAAEMNVSLRATSAIAMKNVVTD